MQFREDGGAEGPTLATFEYRQSVAEIQEGKESAHRDHFRPLGQLRLDSELHQYEQYHQ